MLKSLGGLNWEWQGTMGIEGNDLWPLTIRKMHYHLDGCCVCLVERGYEWKINALSVPHQLVLWVVRHSQKKILHPLVLLIGEATFRGRVCVCVCV